MHINTPLSVSQVLNSHSHVMYILSILLAKYTEIKVSLKSRKIMALNETYDDKSLAINTVQLKILHALTVLPNTIRI